MRWFLREPRRMGRGQGDVNVAAEAVLRSLLCNSLQLVFLNLCKVCKARYRCCFLFLKAWQGLQGPVSLFPNLASFPRTGFFLSWLLGRPGGLR